MEDSILRLRVESQEYDSKIKRAAEGIQDLAKRIHDSQGEFAGLESSQKEFIKDLQYMTTVSKTTTGQARELETAYKQLQALYNSFNGFEKNGEEGKLLAEQLAILKQRTLDAKAAVSDASKSLEDHGSILETLTSKFTVNVDALKLFDMGLKAVKSALDVAKDAFFASEANVDEWGRTMQGAQSLYEGFLIALNNSDVSGFLSSMDDIVNAARAAYDEIDRLGTMKTIQSPQKSAQQAEINRMRMMIQTGRYIAPLDGRTPAPGLKSGQLLTPQQIRNIEKHLQNGMRTMVSLVGNEVKQTGKAIDAYYNSLARQNGMSLKEFREGTSSWAEFSKRMAGYENYKKYESEHTTLAQRYNPQIGEYETYSLRDKTRNPYQQYRNWGTFRIDKQGENSYNDLINYIRQRDQLQSEIYGTQAQGYRVINRANGITVRGIMGGSGSGKTTTATVEKELSIQQQIAALEKEAYTASEERRAEIAKTIQELDKELARQKEIRDTLHGIQKEITTPQIIQGISIQNAAGMNEYLSMLTQQRSMANYGSTAYNNLTSQITDVTTLRNLVGESLKAGLGTSLFDVTDETGRDFWTRAMEGGVENIDWQTIVDKINEARKAAGLDAIKLDFVTGSVSAEKVSNTSSAANGKNDFNKLVGNVSTISGALQQLGVEIPEGFSKTLGILQVISTITMAIQSLVGISASTSILKSIPVIGWFLHNGGVVHAANGFAGTVPGTQFSGDNIPAMLDAGETVLSRSQTNLLASVLNDTNRGGTGRSEAVIESDQIRLVLQNGAQAAGKTIGEYLGIG